MSDAPIYAKTAAGLAEVATRSDRLSMTQRRLLIMADGKRGSHELAGLVPAGTLDEGIALLVSLGLIVKVVDEASDVADPLDVPTINGSVAEPAPAPVADSVITLDAAKRRAVRELFNRLGPDADSLAIKIEACRTADEFRERVREAERLVSAVRGVAAGQEYLRSLRS